MIAFPCEGRCVFFLSFIPSSALFIFVSKQEENEETYQTTALDRGVQADERPHSGREKQAVRHTFRVQGRDDQRMLQRAAGRVVQPRERFPEAGATERRFPHCVRRTDPAD